MIAFYRTSTKNLIFILKFFQNLQLPWHLRQSVPQKVVRTDAATHAVPAWKMSTQGKTGRKKKS